MKSINPEAIGQLQVYRDRLTKLRAELAGAREREAKLQERDERLGNEIKSSRTKLDVLNDKDTAGHAAKERQREMIQEELNDLPRMIEAIRKSMTLCLMHTSSAVRAALHPGLAVILTAGVEAILPFCESRPQAEQIIKNTWAYQAYAGMSSPLWGNGGGNTSDLEAEHALKLMDELIAGRNPLKIGEINFNE